VLLQRNTLRNSKTFFWGRQLIADSRLSCDVTWPSQKATDDFCVSNLVHYEWKWCKNAPIGFAMFVCLSACNNSINTEHISFNYGIGELIMNAAVARLPHVSSSCVQWQSDLNCCTVEAAYYNSGCYQNQWSQNTPFKIN
jgi:hypothetical protein